MNKIQKTLLSKLPKNINLSEITTVVIPLCLGDPRYLEDGCHERLGAGIKNLSPEKSLIIQTGGIGLLPLCDLMYTVVKTKRTAWATRFLSVLLGWGTQSEIANAFSIIKILSSQALETGINVSNPNFTIIISSNKAHLKRIKWFVDIYNENQIHVEYREAHHYFSMKDTLREIFGTPLIKIKCLLLGKKHLIEIHEDEFLSKF